MPQISAEDSLQSRDFNFAGRDRRPRLTFFFVFLTNAAASIHVVWFYLSYVPCYLNLPAFEQGLERTPFQCRVLMMLPLRWAHESTWLNGVAQHLGSMTAWFPRGVRAEGLIEAPIDLICVIITGLVARSIYCKASRTGLLTPYVYPLTLLMITCTYSLYTLHRFRFVYDLPSLAFFSLGLHLLYFRGSRLLFAAVFLVATVNRETSLFLLVFYALASSPGVVDIARRTSHRHLQPLRWGVFICLLASWTAWHIWIGHHFAQNASESWSRVWLNVGILLWPTSWAQILGTFAFCWPVILLRRREVTDQTLRSWQWVLLLWPLVMLREGIFVEVRIFGELIPYMAVMATLIAENSIVRYHLRVLEGFRGKKHFGW